MLGFFDALFYLQPFLHVFLHFFNSTGAVILLHVFATHYILHYLHPVLHVFLHFWISSSPVTFLHVFATHYFLHLFKCAGVLYVWETTARFDELMTLFLPLFFEHPLLHRYWQFLFAFKFWNLAHLFILHYATHCCLRFSFGALWTSDTVAIDILWADVSCWGEYEKYMTPTMAIIVIAEANVDILFRAICVYINSNKKILIIITI